MAISMNEKMDTKQAGEYIGRSESAIRVLVHRRRIPFKKIAGRLYFFKSQIDKWAEQSPGLDLEEVDMR